jgi:hypothetical protein
MHPQTRRPQASPLPLRATTTFFPFFRRRKGYRKTRKINHHVAFAILHYPNSLLLFVVPFVSIRGSPVSSHLTTIFFSTFPTKIPGAIHPLSPQELKARQRNVSNVFEIDKGVSKTQKLPLTLGFSLNPNTGSPCKRTGKHLAPRKKKKVPSQQCPPNP